MTVSDQPRIIGSAEHGISQDDLCDRAISVTGRLRDAGFDAYLVGGCVRDLLIGKHPKDFDVVTDATPEEIRALFRNCRLIGRRFRLAHVHFGRHIVEVATFRGMQQQGWNSRSNDEGRLVRDNVFGTIEEDAQRRDFTINGLFLDPSDCSIRDYVGGFEDLQKKLLRLIGEPSERYREDPVRMLRAARFVAKLGFDLHPDTRAPIAELGSLLGGVPAARLFDESLKLFLNGHALASLEALIDLDLFAEMFPPAGRVLEEGRMLRQAMRNTDDRVAQSKPVTPSFLFAVLLWAPMVQQALRLERNGMGENESRLAAAEDVIAEQVKRMSIPRRFAIPMREIWALQPRFAFTTGKRAKRLLGHPRFRAAYDFLLLREVEEPDVASLTTFWTEIQEVDEETQDRRMELPRRRGRKRKNSAARA